MGREIRWVDGVGVPRKNEKIGKIFSKTGKNP